MIWLYRITQLILLPVLLAHLVIRFMRKKETRLSQRLGGGGQRHPDQQVVWVHAASVGESLSVLRMIEELVERRPDVSVVFTSGTVTSAHILANRLPERTVHRMVPFDNALCVKRFLRAWRPVLLMTVESDLWPEMIHQAPSVAVINARVSEKTFHRLKKAHVWRRWLARRVDHAVAQSTQDEQRMSELGFAVSPTVGNLKLDARPLPDHPDRKALSQSIGERPVVLFASTHPGEEEIAATVHDALLATHDNVLTIIAPRHPERAPSIARMLTQSNHRVASRSKHEQVTTAHDILLADTIGEMGIWYRLANVAVMGGTFARRGGQNPVEPLRCACPVIAGPDTSNFTATVKMLLRDKAMIKCGTVDLLTQHLRRLLSDPEKRASLVSHAADGLAPHDGTSGRVVSLVSEWIPQKDMT